MTQKNFWLMSSSLATSEDVKTLSLLYQPLIGVDGLGTYLLMVNLISPVNLQTDVYPLQYLLDLLNFNYKQFENAVNKLEAIGLLTTFLKDDIYLYRLNMPLKARQFLLDSILGPYLKSEIGESNFDELFSYFSVVEVSREGYLNVTKSFDQVYQVKALDLMKSPRYVFGRKNNGGVVIKDAFDFDALFKELPIRLQKMRLYTNNVRSQIASVMYVYNFTYKEMEEILSLAYDDDTGKIYTDKISFLADKKFRENYEDIKINFEKQPEVEDDYDLSSLTPQDIIQTCGNKMTNQSESLIIMTDFINRNPYDIGLLNAVVVASLIFTEDFPPLAYLEKVLADWLRRGIKNSEDALLVLKDLDNPTKKTTSKKKKKDPSEPEWLDEIVDSFWKDEDL